MGVLMVLWTVLKIILIIVLVLLMLALLLTAVILFSRLDYGIKARYSDRIDGVCKVTWLFGLIKLAVNVKNGDVDFKIKLPFHLEKLFLEDEKAEEASVDKSVTELEEKADSQNAENTEKVNVEKTVEKASEGKKTENSQTKDSNKKNKRVKNKKKEKKEFALYSLWKKFNEIKEKYDIPAIIKLTLKLIKDLLKAVGVKKCSINGVLGFDDPSNTGIALGVIGVLSIYLPGEIYFKGNFEKSDFKCNGVIEGRTNIFKFLLPVLKYIFKKPIWQIIKELLRKDD